MHTSCSSTSVLLPLLYVLFAQTASLPATVSFGNETLLALPIVNIPENPLATGVTPIPVTTRTIVLAFTEKGQPIPEDEVIDTLAKAEQAILDLARDYPTQRIANDRFEYRLPTGNMLISIRTNLGEMITWMELRRVLHALYGYMTAAFGTKETHYQALEFEIEAGGQEKPNVGIGLVWYFTPTESEVQKRVTLPLPISLINEGTLQLPNLTFPRHPSETLRRQPNATLTLPGAKNVQGDEIFHIPKTSLSLSFYFFGPSIPDQNIKATLQGALAKIRPYLNGPDEMDPIEDDSFRWVLPLSREAGIPVAVTVLTYPDHEITWRQLFNIIFGLYAFTTTFGTTLEAPHYQVLGFRILDHFSRKLGVGTLSYFTSETGQLAKRVETIENGILPHRPSAPNILSRMAAVSNSIVYPVADTNIILTFTFHGDTPIPLMEINGALSAAQQKISHAVMQTPDIAISGKFADVSSGLVSTNILAYSGKTITWKELDSVLRGILHYCQDDQDHDHELVFDIDIKDARRGRVGFGTLLYVQRDPINVEKRALSANETTLQLPTKTIIPQPSLTALEVPIPYPIPGTSITLTFDTFGSPIPSIYVNAAFTSALRNIQIHVIHHPDTPIPNNRWERRGAVSNVWITVIAYNGNRISWQELNLVLTAVLRFMTEAGEHRCRGLEFYIDKVGEVATGLGSVAYFPDRDVSVGTGG